MVALQQVLVVDDGVRAVDRSLSGELAGLGYASVTASLEAADDVLAVIAPPAAVLVQASTRRDPSYARRAARLRALMRERGIPVILIGENGETRWARLSISRRASAPASPRVLPSESRRLGSSRGRAAFGPHQFGRPEPGQHSLSHHHTPQRPEIGHGEQTEAAREIER